jgi:PII-like signaling protein
MIEKGYQLEFFMEQDERHGNKSIYEWLIDTAKERGIRGATAFTAALGFGQQRHMHSAHFFELLDQPVQITMIVTEDEANKLLSFLAEEKVDLFYVKLPAEFGRLGSKT